MTANINSGDLPVVQFETKGQPSIAALNRGLADKRDWEAILRRETTLHALAQSPSELSAQTNSDSDNNGDISPQDGGKYISVDETYGDGPANTDIGSGTKEPIRSDLISSGRGTASSYIDTPSFVAADIGHSAMSIYGMSKEISDIDSDVNRAYIYQYSNEWLPYSVHLVNKNNKVKIWIRDKRLNENSGNQLLNNMRRRLVNTGIRIARLVINGSVTWEES